LGKTAEWIESSSGIRERRYAETESVADLGVTAAWNCLARTETAASDIGMLIVSSGSAARGFPGPAAEIAHRLGMGTIPALDVPIASAGSLFALALAMRMAPAHGRILIVAAEKMSELAGDDPNIAMLFGDGAGAAIVSSEPGQWRLVDAVLHSDGQYREDLMYDGTLRMNGMSVILHAARKIPSVIEELLARHSMSAAEVSTYLVHQANQNLLTRVAKALNVDSQTFFSNIARYGNTSSASLFIAASEWAERHPPTGPVVFSAFGAGFHWGAALAMPE
jgi:3-oxoacyl-[acyl-carrier-protein] synthase-3